MKIKRYQELYRKISVISDASFGIEILDNDIFIYGFIDIYNKKFDIVNIENIDKKNKRYIHMDRYTPSGLYEIVITDNIYDDNIVKYAIGKYNNKLRKIFDIVYEYTGIMFNTNIIGIIPCEKYKEITNDIIVDYVPEEG